MPTKTQTNTSTMIQQRIMAKAGSLPEGSPITRKEIVCEFGRPEFVDKSLSRLVKEKQLMRTCRGEYVGLIESRFGRRAPSVEKIVECYGKKNGESLVLHGAIEANKLGLSHHVAMQVVYLTNSKRSQTLRVGASEVHIEHAEPWQTESGNTLTGRVIRALGWLGEEHVQEGVQKLRGKLSADEWAKLQIIDQGVPSWLSNAISTSGIR
jgi:hypothetical protein